MNYAVVLFFDESPCGYAVSEDGDRVRFRPAPHPAGFGRPAYPELTARAAGNGWLVEGTEDPSVRHQVGRLLGQRSAPLPHRFSVAP
ncbi:hypothetical protein [Flaviaesturariibacter aridisoli]|uniref:Uncharacterized protein n=1 Tax=Flaviaesturariibacter aridisoli TaxID=2545761 RepID=A0A4R4E6R4_9BACT|nr:hypothetical protein [Flaviaesturariibacter aridisoli]TCZ74747.1 hypothetical protein E0486_00135 [Flaviaesturariibacter aridisoli]